MREGPTTSPPECRVQGPAGYVGGGGRACGCCQRGGWLQSRVRAGTGECHPAQPGHSGGRPGRGTVTSLQPAKAQPAAVLVSDDSRAERRRQWPRPVSTVPVASKVRGRDTGATSGAARGSPPQGHPIDLLGLTVTPALSRRTALVFGVHPPGGPPGPRKVWEVSHPNQAVPVTLGGGDYLGPRFPEDEVQGHCQGAQKLGLPSLALRFPILRAKRRACRDATRGPPP